jgi:ligand-binding sensor domain-containing protein
MPCQLMILRAITSLLFLLLLTGHHTAGAAMPRPLLIDYTHTAWTELDGAPAGATKFAQAPDGWLWISTPTGLYRFDGVRFERTEQVHGHPLAASNIMGLTTTPDGAVWVGYRVGGVSVFRKDGSHTYAESDGLRPVGVMHIEAAPDGAIWAAMRDGVALLPPGGKRFQYIGPEAGLPSLGAFQILFARDGATWIGTNTGAYFRRAASASNTSGQKRACRRWARSRSCSRATAPPGSAPTPAPISAGRAKHASARHGRARRWWRCAKRRTALCGATISQAAITRYTPSPRPLRKGRSNPISKARPCASTGRAPCG